MANLKNHSLTQFVGATTEPPDIMEVWEYCSKGSLQVCIINSPHHHPRILSHSLSLSLSLCRYLYRYLTFLHLLL